jgi:hypothetical protein
MLLPTDRTLVRGARRRRAVGALVTLALAAWACSDQQSTPDDGSVNADAGQHVDASVSTDGSTADEGTSDSDANLPPDLDAANDETATHDVAGGDADQGDIARDAQSEGVGNDSTVPGDAAIADALDSAPDADTSSPDGDAPPVPIFSDCTNTDPNFTIYAIIDATIISAGMSPGVCTCNQPYAVTEHRILCGSLPPGEDVWLGVCGNVPMVGERWIMEIYSPVRCGVPPAPLKFIAGEVPVSDWDALLAEQIAGHADSGSSDAGTDDDGASDGSNADGSADTSSDATVGN